MEDNNHLPLKSSAATPTSSAPLLSSAGRPLLTGELLQGREHARCCAMREAEETKPMGSQEAAARLHPRPRLMYSYGVSFLTVARKAYHRVEDIGGPMGALVQKLASWAAPILHPLEHQCLSLLSAADGRIIAAESAVESVFPPAAHLFDAVDKLTALSAALPKKFDDAVDQLPALMHRAPLVGWASAMLGGVLEMLASLWEDHGWAGEEIREIGVDSVRDQRPDAAEEAGTGAVEEEEEENAKIGSLGSWQELDDDVGDTHERVNERKEVDDARKTGLGKEEDVIVEEEGDGVEAKRPGEKAPRRGRESEVQVAKDPILDLFDDAWAGWQTRRR